MRMRNFVAFVPLLAISVSSIFSQPFALSPMTTCYQYYIPMKDTVVLATDVCLPILSQDWVIDGLSIQGIPLNPLTVAKAGQQIFWFPQQPNPWQLPTVMTRTPYGKFKLKKQHELVTILGYMSVIQDVRGRYKSAGVYLPMYSDNWDKTPYVPSGWHHPLDLTGGEANKHEDGYETILFVADSLLWHYTDTINFPNTMKISNGKIAMIGPSALGNTQYMAAATKPTQYLKAIMPIVASSEQWLMGNMNGMFREKLITSWLGTAFLAYNWDSTGLPNVKDTIHTLNDFPAPYNSSPVAAWDKAVDLWASDNNVHEPWSFARAVIDVSKAPISPDSSRYEYLDLPIYNINGWWDIYNYTQILSWLSTRRYADTARQFQKLVIGPWAHHTIGKTTTGDMTYPENSNDVLGPDFTSKKPNIPRLLGSEPIQWFRTWLGTPEFILLPNEEWQLAATQLGQDIYVMVPADTYSTPYYEFINFLNGVGGLDSLPIRIKGAELFGFDSNTIYYYDISPTGTSIFGDTIGIVLDSTSLEFDETKPEGIPAGRFYIAGPDDSTGGNWWLVADTFPPPQVTYYKIYLHHNDSVYLQPPSDSAIFTFFTDPKNPALTVGGPNLRVRVPDTTNRRSQGQMLMNNPVWEHLTYPGDTTLPDGTTYKRMLTFVSPIITDSVSLIGFPTIEFWAGGFPVDNVLTDSFDMDFVVRIIDVYPDGREYYVFEGAVNGRAREYARLFAEDNPFADTVRYSNLASNTLYHFKFRTFPIGYTFGKGHRIKVVITGNNHPIYQSNPHVPLEQGDFFRVTPAQMDTATYIFRGTPVKARPAVQYIVTSPSLPASITLPILGQPSIPEPAIPQAAVKPYIDPLTIYTFVNNGNIYINALHHSGQIEIITMDGNILVKSKLTDRLIVKCPAQTLFLWKFTDFESGKTKAGRVICY